MTQRARIVVVGTREEIEMRMQVREVRAQSSKKDTSHEVKEDTAAKESMQPTTRRDKERGSV